MVVAVRGLLVLAGAVAGDVAPAGAADQTGKRTRNVRKTISFIWENSEHSRFAVPVDLVVNVPEGDRRALAPAVDEGRGGLDADAVVVLLLGL